MIRQPDDAADKRGCVLDHHMKAHCQDIALSIVACGDHDDWAWFQRAVGLRSGTLLHLAQL
jgi:hypothetical protein